MNVQSPIRSAPDIQAEPDDIRVMVVDDALLVREVLSNWIVGARGLKLVGAHGDGQEALDHFDREAPDVVVLDVEMPKLDGLAALPRLLKRRRDLAIIVVSGLTQDRAELTLKALKLGALDYIAKPSSDDRVMTSAVFRRELIEKIVALGRPRKRKLAPADWSVISGHDRKPIQRPPFKLRAAGSVPPRVLLIGASTGGPAALSKLLEGVRAVAETAPILVTQHMPASFINSLALQLSQAVGRPVHPAVDGEAVRAGSIYLAPGDRHMTVTRRDGTAVIKLDDGAPVNFCKPAVDLLFTSAAKVWGAWNLALVLTGMGCDGAKGAQAIARAGGTVLAQDETSSVVWGMPGATAATGVCAAVLPLEQIADEVVRLVEGVKS
jgi:two-component system, chemotaxis family, protein-glutamate methylesterase/glutaminase